MFKIGDVEIKNSVVLAPMAGISNPSYIKICEEMGLGYAIQNLLVQKQYLEIIRRQWIC